MLKPYDELCPTKQCLLETSLCSPGRLGSLLGLNDFDPTDMIGFQTNPGSSDYSGCDFGFVPANDYWDVYLDAVFTFTNPNGVQTRNWHTHWWSNGSQVGGGGFGFDNSQSYYQYPEEFNALDIQWKATYTFHWNGDPANPGVIPRAISARFVSQIRLYLDVISVKHFDHISFTGVNMNNGFGGNSNGGPLYYLPPAGGVEGYQYDCNFTDPDGFYPVPFEYAYADILVNPAADTTYSTSGGISILGRQGTFDDWANSLSASKPVIWLQMYIDSFTSYLR